MRHTALMVIPVLLLLVLACGPSDLGLESTSSTQAPANTPAPPTPLPPTKTPPPQANVVIAEAYNANYAEHIVIENRDTIVGYLEGWSLKESDNEVLPFVFPGGFTLAPGAQVRIYSGRDGRQNNPPEAFDWTEKNVWDNHGETVRLYNARGELVSSLKYPLRTPSPTPAP